MLAPHDRENAQFAQRGGSAQNGQGGGIFIRFEAEFLRQIGGGFGGEGRDGGHGAVVGRRGGVVQSGFGWGGCAVSLLPKEKLEYFLEAVKNLYYSKKNKLDGFETYAFSTKPSDGIFIILP